MDKCEPNSAAAEPASPVSSLAHWLGLALAWVWGRRRGRGRRRGWRGCGGRRGGGGRLRAGAARRGRGAGRRRHLGRRSGAVLRGPGDGHAHDGADRANPCGDPGRPRSQPGHHPGRGNGGHGGVARCPHGVSQRGRRGRRPVSEPAGQQHDKCLPRGQPDGSRPDPQRPQARGRARRRARGGGLRRGRARTRPGADQDQGDHAGDGPHEQAPGHRPPPLPRRAPGAAAGEFGGDRYRPGQG